MQRQTSVNSFDVFDTSLVRTVARPDDLFFVLAERLLRKDGKLADTTSIVELARTRAEAGGKARRRLGREDAGLEEIYRDVRSDLWGISPRDMMLEELRLEAECVRPIARTRAELEKLRRSGEPIVFISDTPLPTDHVKEMLEREGLAGPADPIYTSGEIGLTKRSGRLFEHVREREGIATEQWAHRGDDPHCDVSVARRLGIRPVAVADATLNRYERMILNEGMGPPWVSSRLAGVSRATRLMAEVDTARFPGMIDMVAAVMSPLLTSFVAWVLEDAKRRNIERLYFVSRDGERLLEIARVLAGSGPFPECRYLYGSRQAWLLPSLTNLNRDDFGWFFGGSTANPRALFETLGFKPSEASQMLEAHGVDPSIMHRRVDGLERERLWALLERSEVKDLVLSKAASARAATLAYLEKEGLMDSSRWALVDVGWTLQSQWSLRRILATIDLARAVSGYYLAVPRQRRTMAATGPYRALFTEEERPEVQALYDHAVLIETAFLPASHGRVLGYGFEGGEAVPVFEQPQDDPDWAAYVQGVREVMVSYAREALEAGIVERHPTELAEVALRATQALLTQPARTEAESLAWISAVDDLRNPDLERRLAVPLRLSDVLVRFASRNLSRLERIRRLRDRPERYFWEEGSVAISAPWIRIFYRLASRFHVKRTPLATMDFLARRIKPAQRARKRIRR